MNRIIRLVGLALCLLLLFLFAVAATQRWLLRHTEQLGRDAVAAKALQFDRTLALAAPGPLPWTPEFTKTLSEALGASIQFSPEAEPSSSAASASPSPTASPGPSSDEQGRWQFTRALPDATGRPREVRVVFSMPAPVRLVSVYQHTAALLLVLALGLVLIFTVCVLISLRSRGTPEDSDARDIVISARAEIDSLTHLAQVSTRQGTELERERIERQRAEEDAHFQQTLLNRALEEKIRLGHDLHDGIIQSLYAAGLTVEAAKNLVDRDPPEASRQLDSGLKTINTTIREVRSYIAGLSPDTLGQQTFAESIRSLTQTLNAGRDTQYDLRIDDDVARNLHEDHVTHLLQITREAISNALRHGDATQVTVRLHQSAGELCLLVQDNGRGFPQERASSGHGLANMRARATRLGATLQCTSSPGIGTRVLLTMHSPIPAAT